MTMLKTLPSLQQRERLRNYFTTMFWMWTFMVLLNVVMLNMASALGSQRMWSSMWPDTTPGLGHHFGRLRLHPERDGQE